MALALVQDRCTICTKCTIGLEIILDAPVVLLGDEAQVVARFGLFGGSANLDEIYVHCLHQRHGLRILFGCTRWNS
jgi:hypothetical protein